MIHLNECNGADKITLKYATKLLDEVKGDLVGCEMGIAYGGGVEAIGKLWKDRGIIYGFDTFEDLHPTHLAKDPNHFEATCMDHWYRENINGTARLSYDYQRAELDAQGLDNVILIKGEVSKDSCNHIPYLNYVFLDMDILASMNTGYEAVKHKVVHGGYLALHDVDHIDTLTPWFRDKVIGLDSWMWGVMEDTPASHIVVLRRL